MSPIHCEKKQVAVMKGAQFAKYNHRTLFIRTCAVAALSALLTMATGATAAAQGNAKKRGAAPVDRILTAKDNWPVGITYYESPNGKESPAVILLHMQGDNRLVWKRGFAERLQSAGYAVVAVDLRKHGESKASGAAKVAAKKGGGVKLRKSDYVRMVTLDLERVKKFLLEEHHKKKLNIRKTAIISAEMSAPIALVFAAKDWRKMPYPDSATFATRTPRGQDIRAVVLLSPKESLPGIRAGKSLLYLRRPSLGVAFMIGYGTRDALDKKGRTANKIFEKLTAITGNKKRMYVEGYRTKLRGTDMLGRNLPVERHILGFLKKHLAKLPGEWKDRHNRLNN